MRTFARAAVPTLGAASSLLLAAPVAWAHDDHPLTVSATGWVPAVLRCVVLVASAAVCGMGLLRPVAGEPTRATRLVALLAGALATLGVLASAVVTGATPTLAIAQAMLTVLVVLLMAHPLVAVPALLLTELISYEAAAGHAAAELVTGVVHTTAASVWLGAVALLGTAGRAGVSQPGTASSRTRLTPWALGAGAVVVVTGVLQEPGPTACDQTRSPPARRSGRWWR
ncbi:MAG TPA: hypothetical protein VIY28_19100 [Pseudonocardiaceae bacterium]